jgi:hypothetical protein
MGLCLVCRRRGSGLVGIFKGGIRMGLRCEPGMIGDSDVGVEEG